MRSKGLGGGGSPQLSGSWEMLTGSWLSALGASRHGILCTVGWRLEGGPDLYQVEVSCETGHFITCGADRFHLLSSWSFLIYIQ